MHLHVAGTVMAVEVIRGWYPNARPSFTAQLYDDAGEPFSFPVLTADAGIYGYGDHLYCYPAGGPS
jgi:hypothetical protein